MELSVPQGVTQWLVYESTSPEQLLTHLAGADIAITNKVKIRREHLEQLPQLKFIQLTATGMDNIDTQAAKELGIEVKNVVGYSTESVAEHFFMLMLASLRGLKPYHTAVETGVWQADGRFCLTEPTLLDLHTRTLGIIGVGHIGKAITERAKAFGMRVLWAEREGKDPRNSDYTPFEQVLAQSDVLSLNCPLTPETHHLICERTLAKMQRKPLLINVARGAVVDPQAVYDALQQDKILGFASDVFEQEPPRKDDPLMQLAQHPRVLLTPHVAWASEYALDKLWKKVKEQIEQFIQ
jgi:glycerate dehydrogenase